MKLTNGWGLRSTIVDSDFKWLVQLWLITYVKRLFAIYKQRQTSENRTCIVMEELIYISMGGSGRADNRVDNQVLENFSGNYNLSKLRNFNITTMVYL